MAAQDLPGHEQDDFNAFTGGKVFDRIFSEGMALVEETASYLDGQGRDDAKALAREPGLTYAAWSMELTTRLMQAASWLVMQKAVRDGEMRREDASAPKYRIRREDPPLDADAQRLLGLPTRFLDLVERSEALFEQICRLDKALYSTSVPGLQTNPVFRQLTQLQERLKLGAFDPLQVWGRAK